MSVSWTSQRAAGWVLSAPGAQALVVGVRSATAEIGPWPVAAAERPTSAATGRAVSGIGTLLTERCGLPSTALQTRVDPPSPAELLAQVRFAAGRASSALVVYVAGPVLLDGDGAAYLDIGVAAAGGAAANGRGLDTAVALTDLADAVASTAAATRMLLLDGRDVPAAPRWPGGPTVPAAPGRDDIEIVATVWSPEVVPDTASTTGDLADATEFPLWRELHRLLVDGDPDGPATYTVGHLTRRLAQRHSARGLPMLHRAAPWSDGVSFAANYAHTPPVSDVEPARTRRLVDGPGPVVTPSFPVPSQAGAEAGGGSFPDGHPESVPAASPYPGLASFDAASEQVFFGRERATADVLSRLESRVDGGGPLVLVGVSGSGKSSLLRAGVLPALARGAVPDSRAWPQVLMTPGEHPMAELNRRVAAAAGLPVLGTANLDLVSGPDDFVAALREMLAVHSGQGRRSGTRAAAARVVVVVDQLEETFTLCSDEAERASFVRALVAASSSDDLGTPPAVVVLGVRADFYGWCAAYPELVDALQTGQVVIGPMTEAEVRDAVTKPADRAGVRIEPGLVDLMVHDVGADELGAVSDPGSLPLLAHALRVTWAEREGQTMTVAGYLRVGGMHGAVAQTAEQTYAAFDADEQATARQLLMRMVRFGDGTDDTRRRVRRDELASAVTSAAEAESVLAALVAARLVAADADDVQLSHEALLRSWPRLREWIDLDRAGAVVRQQVVDAGTEWEDGGRDPSFLFGGTRLAAVRDWSEPGRRRDSLTPTAREFLDASVAAERAQQRVAARRASRMKQLVAGLTVLFLLATGAMAFAFWQRTEVAAERDRALSQRIGAQADQLRETDSLVAAQLAAVAWEVSPTAEARGALLNTFSSGYGFATRQLGEHRRPVGAVAYSSDGRLVATASDDWTVGLWAADEPGRDEPVGRIEGHSLAVKSVAFSPDGRILATGSDDRTVKLWDVSTPAAPILLATLPQSTTSVFGLAFHPAGRLLAVGGYDDHVELWDVSSVGSPELAGVVAHPAQVRALDFSLDGRHLVTGGDDGHALLWDVRDPATPVELSSLVGEVPDDVSVSSDTTVRAVAFSPDGTTVVTAGDDTETRVFDVTDPLAPEFTAYFDSTSGIVAVDVNRDGLVAVASLSAVRVYDPARHSDPTATLPHGTKPWAVAFSPDGRHLATGAEDAALRIWDVPGQQLVGQSRFLWSAAVSPDGELAATGGYDQAVQVWDLRDPARPRHAAELSGFTSAVDNVVFSRDGQTLVVAEYADDDSRAEISAWSVTDPARPTLVGSFDPATGGIEDLALSPDGRLLAVAGFDASVTLWDVTDFAGPRRVGAATGHRYDANAVAFSPDGLTLVTGSSDRSVRVWDVSDPTRPVTLSTVTGFTTAVLTVAVAPDNRTLAVGSLDTKIDRWDIADRAAPRPLSSVSGLGAAVNEIGFSADGRLMAAALGNARPAVRLWDVSDPAEPQPYATFTGRYNGFASVRFAPDGSYVLGAPNQVVGFVWPLEPEAVVEEICARAGDQLTREEWDQLLPDLEYDPPCS